MFIFPSYPSAGEIAREIIFQNIAHADRVKARKRLEQLIKQRNEDRIEAKKKLQTTLVPAGEPYYIRRYGNINLGLIREGTENLDYITTIQHTQQRIKPMRRLTESEITSLIDKHLPEIDIKNY